MRRSAELIKELSHKNCGNSSFIIAFLAAC